MWEFPPIWDARCLQIGDAMVSGAILNTISEFILAILPIPVVFHLRMTGRQRWIILSILSLGFFVTIVGCFRTYFLWRAIQSYDQAWWALPHWIASEVEIDTSLVSTIRNPHRRHANKILFSDCFLCSCASPNDWTFTHSRSCSGTTTSAERIWPSKGRPQPAVTITLCTEAEHE
jgi:hypothetical protein